MNQHEPPTTSAQKKNAVRGDGWDQRWRMAGLCLALAAITFFVFGQTLHHEFLPYDDDLYVYENPVVASGLTLKGIVWAFTGVHAGNWHPLTWLSHMLDCQLYGLNPGGHHLTNVLLHTATVIALFLVLRQMTGALWRSAFVAAVFAIHPLRVESVAWVSERKDVLSGLFFMLTIGAYVRYARQPWSPARYGLVMLLFAMGLMCKPMLVTLPLVLLLLDYWPLQRKESTGKLVIEKLPLLALSAASCVATVLAQNEAIQSTVSFSMPLRFGNAVVTCMIYLGQMIWPAGLAAFYPYPHNGLSMWEAGLAGMVLAGLSAAAFGQRRKRPWMWVGWFWYLLMLLPVAGIIQVGGQAHADRYTYLPQIGIYLCVTWVAAEWAAKRQTTRIILEGLMPVVIAVLMVCAWKQTAYWKDGETLWNHTLACTTGNADAHHNLGVALQQNGKVDEAIAQYQEALQLNPGNEESHNNLGGELLQKGRVDEAITHFQKALEIKPAYSGARNNLGVALLRKGRVDEAIAQYRQALEIDPNNALAHVNLGDVLLQRKNLDEAIAHFQKALEIDPGYGTAHNSLGNALWQKGSVAEAISHFKQALEITPDNATIHRNLAACLNQMGRVEEAISQYQIALQIEPADPGGQNNLAVLLATCSRASLRNGAKAVALARQANLLTGGENPIILHTLAAAFAEAGRFSEAVETAQHALRLAEAQSNAGLAEQLQSEIKLYQAGRPYHVP